MNDNELLPLAVWNCLDIEEAKGGLKKYAEAQLSSFVSRISDLPAPGETLLCVIPISGRISRQARYKLEQKLTDLIESALPDKWKADMYLIKKKSSLKALMNEAEMLIHKISFFYPYETIIQLTGTGDNDCFQAVFIESVRQLGSRHGFLFDKEGQSQISISRSVVSNRSWKLQIRSFLMEYDFAGAIELVKDKVEAPKSMEFILKMMDSRMNFCFKEAHQYLQECEKLLGADEPVLKETKKILHKLLSKEGREKDLALIEELYRQMEICIELDDLPAFLTRFYRAREAILLFLLVHGAKDKDSAAQVKKSSIYQLIEELEKKYENGDVENYIGAYFYLKSLNVAHTLQVRNQSFIGHGREEIKSAELWHSYFGTKRTTVSRAKRRFLLESNMMLGDLGAAIDDNYSDLIDYLLKLELDIQPKGQESNEKSRVLPL
ncbi:hypothetical protein [Peribacillus deserti]|uniref:Uncharacterized protein n=1 Tax=Peribacillus deserti TaxID=673318 RepID=A0A2N5M2J6_9BACI|nr:hypothetical protein [Peribacillus deserti]PLT28596.1 hypothetical protein CUU66_17665 [Peribacillus deserti]